jgi:hypothetical protein
MNEPTESTEPKLEAKLKWTLERVEQMRKTGVEESLTLDYKRAGALDRSAQKTALELTKDVSAFANSSGGTLIYGVGEDPTNPHLPGELDPISRADVSKEWLEAIILNIQPHIDGIEIHPIPISKDRALYVIEMPQSTTAHQATDHKYYKRWNFSSQPMEDYEIRDVMNRTKHPRIVLSFTLHRYIPQDPLGMPRFGKEERREVLALETYGENKGLVLAQYVFAKIFIPSMLVPPVELWRRGNRRLDAKPEVLTFSLNNKKQERGAMGNPLSDVRFEPILPELNVYLGHCELSLDTLLTEHQNIEIPWQVHADNALPVKGTTRIGDISVKDSCKA